MGRRGRGKPYGVATYEDISRARIETLSAHPSVKTAARVARTFGIDPLVVLDEADDFRAHVRIAAWMVTQHDDEEEARRSKK